VVISARIGCCELPATKPVCFRCMWRLAIRSIGVLVLCRAVFGWKLGIWRDFGLSSGVVDCDSGGCSQSSEFGLAGELMFAGCLSSGGIAL
jgi:hypothetical protein